MRNRYTLVYLAKGSYAICYGRRRVGVTINRDFAGATHPGRPSWWLDYDNPGCRDRSGYGHRSASVALAEYIRSVEWTGFHRPRLDD